MNNTMTEVKTVPFKFPLELIKQEETEGEFHVVGYAATTDFDLQGDVITEDALRESSLDLIKNSTVLLNHDLKKPIGRVTKVQFDMHGLLIDVLISKTEPDIIQKIKEGVLNKFSIRGQVLERERKFIPELDRTANVILRMSLVEVSLVSVPANPEARAIGWYVSKALDELDGTQEPNLSGGNPMKDNEMEVEEVKPAESGTSETVQEPQSPAPEPKTETPKPDVPATQESVQVSADEIQKMLLQTLRQEIGQIVSAEVAKQLEAAVKAVPTLRKGLVEPDNAAQDLHKQFENLAPEQKLKVALTLQS